jgi:hypothetical protein
MVPLPQIKVCSMILTFGQDGIEFQCTNTNHRDDGLLYACSMVLDRNNEQFIFDGPSSLSCSQMANVTEIVLSISEFEKIFFEDWTVVHARNLAE